MTLHPDEQARECAEIIEKGIRVSFRMQDSSDSSKQAFISALAALIEPFLAQARLAEAEWWHFQEVGAHDCEAVIETAIEHVYPDWPRGVQDCQRIAKMRQAAGDTK